MTLFDTITTDNIHAGPGLCVSLNGARYHGVREMAPGYESIVVFTDPVTSLTLTMPQNEVTIGNVYRALRKHRADHFGVPQSA